MKMIPLPTHPAPPPRASTTEPYRALLHYVEELKGRHLTTGERDIIEALARDGAMHEVE